MTKARTLAEKIKQLPADRRRKVEARAAELMAEEMSLRDLCKTMNRTQVELAKVQKVGQDTVSSSPPALSDRKADLSSPSSQPLRTRCRHTRCAILPANCVNCADVGARARCRRGLRWACSTFSYTPSNHSM